MKKSLILLPAVVVLASLLMIAFEAAKPMDGEERPVYQHSSSAAEAPQDAGASRDESDQAKIDEAFAKIEKALEREKDAKPGEVTIVGDLDGGPLYGRTEPPEE